MVSLSVSYFGASFKCQHGMTQGYPLYMKIFNVVVDVVLSHWVLAVAEAEGGIGPADFGWEIQLIVA